MKPVSIDKSGDIAIVRISNPPINALSQPVREGLMEACRAVDDDTGISAVVLICDGRTFVAGADIREFNLAPMEPHLPDVIHRIERSAKPWVAAVHGTALGGGCELCLGCHYRVAVPSASFGLPEVNLGLIPGAGGTVRTPRLIGVERALQLVTSGKPIGASEALETGLIDAMAPDEGLEDFALEFARSKQNSPLPVALTEREAGSIPEGTGADELLAGVAARARGQLSPVEAANAVLEGASLPAEEALKRERERFLALKQSDQSAALRHAFFAERQTSKIPEIKNITPEAVSACGVIGGGTMGAGIAAAMLLSGHSVTMVERDEDSACAGAARVEKILDASRSRGLVGDEAHKDMLSAFTASINYSDLGKAELVVEAVFEDMEIKKQVFGELSKACNENAILATNTSYLDVNEIADATPNPDRVIGLHFFSPAHIMKLVEVIKTETVSSQTLSTVFAFARKLKKVPVLSGVCDGFIGNRILAHYRKQCDYMLEDGADPQVIDAAFRDMGMAMGPFEMQDMAGLDIGWANRKRLAPTRDPSERYVKIADRICELGRFGQKTGAGWYQYPDGSRKGIPDPVVEAIIAEERDAAGIVSRDFTSEEIQTRILQAMASEGQKILNEGIARSAADIDVVFILGYGFPRWRGGPMFASGIRDAV